MKASRKTISETDVYLYAGISCDTNPVHLNEEYAKKTMFKKRIAHGMLTAGLIFCSFRHENFQAQGLYI